MKEKAIYQVSPIGWQRFINNWRWLLVCGVVFGCVIAIKYVTVNPIQKSTINTYFSCPADGDIYHGKFTDSQKQNIKGVIIPHHLIANSLIDETLAKVDTINIDTVVLIGPNHPNRGEYNIQTSRATWQTGFGIIGSNQGMVNRLVKDGIANIYEYGVEMEHSICGDIPFVKKYFPNTRVVPLTIKSGVKHDEQRIIGKWLANNCKNCLVIGSVDFSHDLTPGQAILADKISTEILISLNTDSIENLTADSSATLGIVMWYVKELGITKGTQINRSDANEQLKLKMENVTSYITIVY